MEKKTLLPRPRVVQQIRPKANLPSGSFIALGGRPNTPEPLASISSQSSGPSGIKREGGPIPASLIAPAKKIRPVGREVTDVRQSSSPINAVISAGVKRDIAVENIFQGAASDVCPSTFPNRVSAAEEKGRGDKVEKLLLGLVKFLYENRAKPPDPAVVANFCFMARDKPQYFKDNIIEGLCACLRKYVGIKATVRCHQFTYQLVCSTIFRALCNRENWPEALVKAYLDDALGDRAWVDRKDCNLLVQNIITAFGTEEPSAEFFAYLYYGEGSRSVDRAGGGSPVHPASSPLYEDDSRSRDAADLSLKFDEESNAMDTSSSALAGTVSTNSAQPRFTKNAISIRNYTIELLRDWWSRRLDTVPKGLLKTMATCCGYPEVRLFAAQKLDAWLQNAKLQRIATELMMYVCINFQESTDMETLSCLTRLRFKSRLVQTNFCYVLKELFTRAPASLPIVLKLVLHNELSTTRVPHNMLIIGQCFQFDSEMSSQTLANICFELLSSPKDDYLRALRGLIREVVRSALKFDFPMNAFCRALIQERSIVASFDQPHRERVFHALEDLVCLTAFLGIGPTVRDAALALANSRGDRRDIAALTTYQRNVIQLQNDAVTWLQTVVPSLFRPAKEEYVRSCYRLTFMEKPDFYSTKDNWPTDQERNLFLKIISEAGLDEDLLLRVLSVGLASENPLSPSAALDLTEQLVRRAALAVFDPKFTVADQNTLKVNNFSVIDLLFNCCRYRPPDSYQLPPNYVLPMLAIINLFWKSVTILLILAACNASTVGRIIWENYPTIQYIMEMAISGDFVFPPATVITGSLTADDIKRQDLQITETEKQEILELEGYLATNVVINENNSSLLAHLMRLDLKGPARRPPHLILDGFKQLNQQLNLGLAFCRSRDPDFLLEIIGRQGSSHSLPWLIQLIQKNEGSLGLLPVQCLCEFLLHHLEKEKGSIVETEAIATEKSGGKGTELQNSKELRQRLIEVVWKQAEDAGQTEQTLLYFFSRLQADSTRDRQVAIYALEILLEIPEEMQMVLSKTVDQQWRDSFQWLLDGLPSIPHFASVRGKVVDILAKCATVETDLRLLRSYIAFLHQHSTGTELDDVALNLGKMIYGRRPLIDHLLDEFIFVDASTTLAQLLDIFKRHLEQVRSAHSDVINWSASQDQLLIHWGDTASATMHVNVVAATYLLLGHPKPEGCAAYDQLMESWFPSDQSRLEAFMIDTSEPAELIPEDVKFQLLRSKNELIIDSVLETMDDRQVLTCIEYSGLPPNTISKICTKLDTRIIENKELLTEMRARSKTWLGFLMSHAARGASVGSRFIEWCKANAADPAPAEGDQVEKMDASLAYPASTGQPIHVPHLDRILSTAFIDGIPTGASDQRTFTFVWSQLLIQLSSTPSEHHRAVLQWLSNECDKNAIGLADGLSRNKGMAVCIFRILEQNIQDDNQEEYRSMCRQLMKEEKRLDPSIAKLLRKHKLEEAMDVQQTANASSSDELMDDSQASQRIVEILDALRQGLLECEEDDVDRVLRLDPEIVRVAPWKQLEYLFGPNNSVGLRHLLSLLPHWGHVDTLRSVVEKLLSGRGKEYDCKKALDFIAAVVELPRLWEGREPKLPRHYRREPILHLTDDQFRNLLHFIVKELSTMPTVALRCDPASTGPSMPVQEKATTSSTFSGMEWTPHGPLATGLGVPTETMEGSLKTRLRLLLECCEERYEVLVEWLTNATAPEYDRNVCRVMLLELYFARPEISRYIPNRSVLQEVNCLVHAGYTSLDEILIRLLNTYFRCAENGDLEKELDQVDASLRQHAAENPTIMIRHTPLIAACLRGTTSMSLRKMDRTNYLKWYDMIINLLDSLRPAVFDHHYAFAVMDILSSLFDFIQNHGLRSQRHFSLVESVVKFCRHYHDLEQELAFRFLQSRLSLLQAIMVRFPMMRSIKEILTELSMPMPTITSTSEGTGTETAAE